MVKRMMVVDFKRTIGIPLLMAILLVLITQLQGISQSFDEIMEYGDDFSVIEMMHFSFETGTFQLLVPTIASFVYAAAYYEDRKDGYIISHFVRTGNSKAYLVSKIISVYASGMLAVFIGMLLFLMLLCAIMPVVPIDDSLAYSQYACGQLLIDGKPIYYLLSLILFRTAAAGCWALCGLAVSTVTDSLFSIYTIPSIAAYMLNLLMAGTIRRFELGMLMNKGNVVFEFIQIMGFFLVISAVWGSIFMIRAGRQVRS